MKITLALTLLLAACGGSTGTNLEGDGGSDGSTSNDTGTTSDGGGGPETGNGDAAAPCGAKAVDLTFANCPSAPTCGGSIVDGVYDYTKGCISDPWGQAKQNCPTLQVSNEKGSVQGCITFAAGVATRNVQSSYGATLAVPTACLLGGTCAQLQSILASYFTSATCTAASSGCTCDVSSTYSGIGATSYTTSNAQVVTSANNKYDYCVGAGTIDMQWISGPNPEPGVYTLTKQ